MGDTTSLILFWVFLPYDALVILPYFWARVALGIATALFIPHRTIGLTACALGNVAIFAYAVLVSWNPNSIITLTKMLNSPLEFWMIYLSIFIGVVWWFVGRIMRWAYYKTTLATKSTTPTPP